MDDDKLRQLFNDFRPEMSSSSQFMTRLQKNMEVVEILKQHNKSLKKRNRLAVVIAAFCGFATGVILTSLYPLIVEKLTSMNFSLPEIHFSGMTIDFTIAAWIVMAGLSVVAALNAYEVALAKLPVKSKGL